MDDSALRDKAREVVLTGNIPARRPDRIWGGPGGGAECLICNAPVTHDQVEFEVEFVRGEETVTHHLHVDCFTAWEGECEERS
jgi:hypothetical protein